jgi:hypothetical protein
MKLDLSSCDFQEHTITFKVPEKIMKQMGFYSCKLEVDVEHLFDSAVLPDNDNLLKENHNCWNHTSNLLKETKEAITNSGHSENDIIFIGSDKFEYSCTWEEYKRLTDVEYDQGYGIVQVAFDLIIVFSDGNIIFRWEDDGSEWWKYYTQFNFRLPGKTKPINRIFIFPTDKSGWKKLKELN